MTRAILTMDDGASSNTVRYVAFLNSLHISPLMFFWGERLESAYEQGIKALQMGAVAGNHSYSHPHFSDLSFAQCVAEIEKQEALLNRLYQDAGIARSHKLFRFPYGDKGGKHAPMLQQYLMDQGFSRLEDSGVTYPWYRENGLRQDMDVFWTFDLKEYRMHNEEEFTLNHIYRHMEDPHPLQGGSLQDSGSLQIILIHDHPETEAKCPGYFKTLIRRLLKIGVVFENPDFCR